MDEILVINDSGTDSAIDVAKNAGATIIYNIVISNLCKTIQRGYDEAIKRGADNRSLG